MNQKMTEIKVNDTITINDIDYVVTHYNDFSDNPKLKAHFSKTYIYASMEVRRVNGTKTYAAMHTIFDKVERVTKRGW